MKTCKELEEAVCRELSIARMKQDAEAFSKWERYSGSPDGEASVDYLIGELDKAGIANERLRYELLRSLPVKASVTVKTPESWTMEATAAVYSGQAQGLEGELLWDEACLAEHLTDLELAERYERMKGRIVLTYDISFSFYYEAARAGALGIVAIWPKELHHHDTMGGVWGMPGTRDRDLYPYLPYVQVIDEDGRRLRQLVSEGPVTVSMEIAMDNRVVTSSMPIATIPGRSEKFVLLSGHYDSWYEGMTDNGAANVLMLEIARVLKAHQDELYRTVVIAWWSGHSDGRYSGSAWYCDHYYEYLRNNCVAHINMDICGCRGSNAVRFDMTGMEGDAFNDAFLAPYNKRKPLPYRPLDRSSDQTFWGVLTPVSIAPQFYIDDETKPQPQRSENILEQPAMPPAFGVGGPFYWWHTKEDTLDKIGDDVLARVCEIGARLVCRYAMENPLPLDIPGFMEEMERYFRAFKEALDPAFDVSSVLAAIKRTRRVMERLTAAMDGRSDTDDVLMRTAGELVRLKFTYSSPYKHDYAVEHEPYGVFASLLGVHRENTTEELYLMHGTDFVRQRNRMVFQLNQVCEAAELALYRWRAADLEASSGLADGVHGAF